MYYRGLKRHKWEERAETFAIKHCKEKGKLNPVAIQMIGKYPTIDTTLIPKKRNSFGGKFCGNWKHRNRHT